jgi:hypothetical protein
VYCLVGPASLPPFPRICGSQLTGLDLDSCLDDSELQFLGAPWEEYGREASVVGLDVLRYVPFLFRFFTEKLRMIHSIRNKQNTNPRGLRTPRPGNAQRSARFPHSKVHSQRPEHPRALQRGCRPRRAGGVLLDAEDGVVRVGPGGTGKRKCHK